MFGEFTHLQEIVELLLEQTADPTSLPQSCEQVILDVKKGRGEMLKSVRVICRLTFSLRLLLPFHVVTLSLERYRCLFLGFVVIVWVCHVVRVSGGLVQVEHL